MQPEIALHRMRFRFICRFGSIALGILGLGLLPGCGNVLYAYRANSASSKLEEARQAGAERTALYEYTLAREHLEKAKSEASEADYGDASELAALANDYAEIAVEKAKRRRATQAPQGNATATDSEMPSPPPAASNHDAQTNTAKPNTLGEQQ